MSRYITWIYLLVLIDTVIIPYGYLWLRLTSLILMLIWHCEYPLCSDSSEIPYFMLFSSYYMFLLLGDCCYMMRPKARKPCRSLLPDALSYLPDNIIDVILMCLPCKDAVRTSILSKKWRYHWCRLTKLELDESLWKTKKDLLNPTIKFTKIMYQLLTLHEGPITKFTLDVVHLASCPNIDNFIYFLSRNDIQHLELHLPLRKEYKLPSLLFTCSQLRHLSLCYCSIQHPSAFQGFDKLISLNLWEVNISSELLGSLIAHCPSLEELELDIADKSDTIEIKAPMLRLFDLSGNISSICLKNVPRLVKVLLYGDYIKAEDLDFAKVFESCPSLEHLLFFSLDSAFSAGAGYEAPTRLPLNLNSVKRFYLPDVMLVESYMLSYALCLIRSFPYLENLEIEVHVHYESEDDEDEPIPEPLELKHLSDVTFNHLKEVKLGCLSGTASELLLIKFLLAESPVLERMLIDRRYLDHQHLDTRLQIFAEISNFSRASPKAEVVYIDLSRALA
ncbi:F-box/FBD/LRR-repeat protein At1g13570-like isoform X2 [Solanum dulcamara]|uniref:F-box/FBD/LRR-repeat protein At1g13570-like isoform X2 n=1 Tax=Solanum dulcamara TaxID=45834 RepID=UPI0024869296|nr:F-box/FBD/LRR-repeat protein At1g13570-like isoform X2 [Solanum dulcamara]